MSGAIPGLHPVQAALVYSFEHARRDLTLWTQGLSTDQLWRWTGEVAPVGFHILHIGGSVDRLLTYARGQQLSQQQLQELSTEQELRGLSRDHLLATLEDKLRKAETLVREMDVTDLEARREIGRKRIPVPLGVLLVHIAEHTQRHVGESIVTTKLVR